MIKNIFKKINCSTLLLFLGITLFFLSNPAPIAAQSGAEVENLEQQAINQAESELQSNLSDLNQRKQDEINIVEQSQIDQSKKDSMINRINTKYSTLIRAEETKANAKRSELKSYYSQMRKDLNVLPQQKGNNNTFIQPQKLIGKWFIRGYQFLGTLKFSANNDELVANIYLFKYNKWEDLYNLTYDGLNIAFDYENPYGMKLHFEGQVKKNAKAIKGDLMDLNTKKIYKWKAYQ